MQVSPFSDTPSVRNLLPGMWGHLTTRRRIQLGLLLFVMLSSGVAELVSLGSVLPFLAVLSDPELLWQESLVQALAARVGYTQPSQLLLPATLTFVLAVVIAALVRLANLWLNVQLAAAVGSDLSCEAYRRTLHQPYIVHLQRNSAEVITGITVQITRTVAAMNSLLQLITSSVVAVFLFAGLLWIDAPVAVAAAILFGSAYGVLAITARRELRRNSHKISEASTEQLKALNEGLGAIRDLLLDGNQLAYVNIYKKADRLQRKLSAKNKFLSSFPRYALEALCLVAIAILGSLIVLQKGTGASVISSLGALALGAQRLLPALQQIYSGWASLKGFSAAMDAVLGLLNQSLPPQTNCVVPLLWRHSVCLDGVSFFYGPELPPVLNNLNLCIRRGERIGLIGCTGSGKSTTVDMLMGLLVPTSGKLLVDGVDLHSSNEPRRLESWRAGIAHVPQNIYLADSSFAENIAFGVSLQEIDMHRVKQAASQAQIAGFIEASPNGYHTFVGERGISISGGQRQRIGIARAFYKQAQLLVFDEATSALDIVTEKAVMETLHGLSSDLTVIFIAHRFSTLAKCDRVFEIKDGRAIEKPIQDFTVTF